MCIRDREWFEVYNASANDIDLFGLVISDLGTDRAILDSSVIVASGAYAVLGDSTNIAINGNVPVDAAYTGIALGNGDDELILSNASGVLDEILWDGGPTWPNPSGASLSLDPASQDETSNDDGHQ